MIKVWVDGAARPNPGKGGVGIVIRGDNWDYTISQKCDNRESSNSAEYKALCQALTELMRNQTTDVETIIYSDSQLLIEQMNNGCQVDKASKYAQAYLKAQQLARYFSNLKFEWISRKENDEANLLASQALKKEF